MKMARKANKKIEHPKVISAVEWYQVNRDFYKRLELKIELIIKEILEDCQISFHSVTSRSKDIESFAKKASKDKYSDPKTEILDLAGIRITAYVESDVNKICEVLEREFEIIQEHSVNKSAILKYNEVGYRSIHYIAKLDSKRMQFPEYRRLNAPFEIQVRTVLQHAWAEIEHDRNYKFEGAELPEHAQIKRRFALLAGQLELADREFDSIVKDIEVYSNQVTEDTKKGNFDIQIDSISLMNYLMNKFNPALDHITASLGYASKEIVQELLAFGITKISDLDVLINKRNFVEIVKEEGGLFQTFTGALRGLMIIEDAKKYFDESYQGAWVTKEGNPIIELAQQNGVTIEKLKELKVIA